MPSQLLMRRVHLPNVPPLPEVPPGLAVRTLLAGEEPLLACVLTEAFAEGDPWTEETVRRRLTEAPDVEAVYVVADADGPVATASARYAPDDYPDAGYLHWVGAGARHRGRGLGRLVTLRVLHHFREAGRACSVLETDDFRLPAIRTYLGLGYVPEMREPEHVERWKAVMRQLRG